MLQWSLDDERCTITGHITKSRSKYYRNGEVHTIMYTSLTSYPSGPDMGPYYLARNQMGYYFKCMVAQRA